MYSVKASNAIVKHDRFRDEIITWKEQMDEQTNWQSPNQDIVCRNISPKSLHSEVEAMNTNYSISTKFLSHTISLSVHQRIFPLTSTFQERIWFQERMFQILATHFAYRSHRFHFFFIRKQISPCIFQPLMSKLPCKTQTHFSSMCPFIVHTAIGQTHTD